MPAEIRIQGSFTGSKDGVDFDWSFDVTPDWDSAKKIERTQTIGTTYEAIDIPSDMGSSILGFICVHNLDATNFVDVGIFVDSSFYKVCRVEPRTKSAPIPLALTRTEVFAKADSSSVEILYLVTAA